MRSLGPLFVLLMLATFPRVAEAQRSCVAPTLGAIPDGWIATNRAGGGIVGTLPVAERVRRIPVRAPLALPSEGFPLFIPTYAAPAVAALPAPEAVAAAPRATEAAAIAPKAGAVRRRAETVYYTVEGMNRADLTDALRARGPNLHGRQFFGLTEWEVSVGYRSNERSGTCTLDDLTVNVNVTTHLPRWRRSATVSSDLKSAWDRFVTALDRHEHGHRLLAEEAAEVMRDRLLAVSVPSCDGLDGAAHGVMTAVMQEYEARNLAYDAETGHGRTQGAVWPRH